MEKEIELYRYIKWDDYNKSILTKNELSFYSAEKWKEDGEFDFELNFSEEEEKLLTNYFKNKLERLSLENPLKNNDYSYIHVYNEYKHSNEYMKFIVNNTTDLIQTLLYPPSFLLNHACEKRAKQILSNKQEAKDEFKRILFNNYKILCLSKTHKSYDLWSFKRNSCGENIICLKLNSSLILDFLQNTTCIRGKEIEYDITPPCWPFNLIYEKNINQLGETIYQIMFSLRNNLFEEKEFRLISLNQNSITFDNNLIEKAIIYKHADPEVIAEVQKYCKKIEFADINYEEQIVEIEK